MRAEECGREAAEAVSQQVRNDYLRIQQTWLKLARSYEFGELLAEFSKENARRRAEFFSNDDQSVLPFPRKNQEFIEPIRCARCGGRADLVRRIPDKVQKACEIRSFQCRECEHVTTTRARYRPTKRWPAGSFAGTVLLSC
jgi:hypothetical protein